MDPWPQNPPHRLFLLESSAEVVSAELAHGTSHSPGVLLHFAGIEPNRYWPLLST